MSSQALQLQSVMQFFTTEQRSERAPTAARGTRPVAKRGVSKTVAVTDTVDEKLFVNF
jgi:methyl-accepting chemotaxis protein